MLQETKMADATDLRDNCSRLLTWVKAGEDVIITQDGVPVARMVSMDLKLTDESASMQPFAAIRETKGNIR